MQVYAYTKYLQNWVFSMVMDPKYVYEENY